MVIKDMAHTPLCWCAFRFPSNYPLCWCAFRFPSNYTFVVPFYFSDHTLPICLLFRRSRITANLLYCFFNKFQALFITASIKSIKIILVSALQMSMTACITRVVGTEYKHARDLLAGDVRRKATFTLNIAGIDVLYY